MTRNSYALVTEGGKGSSSNGGKQEQSDGGSMIGWEVMGIPRCQPMQNPDGWTNTIQLEDASAQRTTTRASMENLPNGTFGVLDKDKGTDDALSLVGQQSHVEKEKMEVSGPLKPKVSLTNAKTSNKDHLSLIEEGNGKAKCHWKKIIREKGKNKIPLLKPKHKFWGQ